LGFVAAAIAAPAAWIWQPPAACPIADGDREPWAGGWLGVSPTETIEHSSDSYGFVEGAGHMSLGYYRLTAGTLDLTLRGRLWISINGDHYEIPSVFGQLYLRSRWDLRLQPGLTLRTDLMPGYYAEVAHIEPDDFTIPVTVSTIAAVDRQLAGQIGFGFYPGFENWVDPLLRVRWQPWPTVTADVGYPETRIQWKPLPELAILGGYEFNRVWQFSLSHSDEKGDFMLRDQRLYVGIEVGSGTWWTLSAKLIWLIQRELDYEAGLFQDAKVDDGILFALGLSGEF